MGRLRLGGAPSRLRRSTRHLAGPALPAVGNAVLAEHIEWVGLPLYRRGDRVAA
ncbi:MAG: hypothetical protein H6747_01295 [Deltaproteobacteria bacterium]|nr:hypothetical protein [Deltaproteobacteria bacterium]